MSLRIVPAAPHSTAHSHLATHTSGAPSAPGLHDLLRSGVGPSVTTSSSTTTTSSIQLDSTHPLEARLAQWTATQDSLKMTGLRRTFGIAEPIRRGMELRTVREGSWRPMELGGGAASVHEDILNGRDTSCDWEDVFTGAETRSVPGMHDEMERKVKMGGM